MNPRVPVALFLILTFAVACLAQTPRRRAAGRTTATKPTSAQTPPAKPDQIPPAAPPLSSTNAPPGTMAIVNDVTITSADIEQAVSARIMNDPDIYLRDFYQNREKAIREARQRAVDVRLNSLLLAAAAKLPRRLTRKFALFMMLIAHSWAMSNWNQHAARSSVISATRELSRPAPIWSTG
jgi:hypothetical protein